MMGEMVSEYPLWLLLLMQGTACLVLGLVGSYALKRRASRAHQVLVFALLAAVLMPAAYLGVRHFELGVLAAEAPGAIETPRAPQPVAAEVWTEAPEAEAVEPATVAVETPTPARAPSVDLARALHLPWRVILLTCWAIAMLALATRLALRFILGVFLLRNARPVDTIHIRQALDEACERMSVTGPVSIRANSNLRSPVIWCWSRFPALLVPTDAVPGAGARDWVGVFCHELAHLKRRDHVTGLFAELLICLAPWHPLLWWARKQLLRFSEEACDDWVLAGGQIGVDYAESLLELSPQPELAFVPTVVGKEKTMKARIRRIVQERCGNPHIGRRWATIVTILVLGMAVGVAFAQRRPASRPEIEHQEQRELMIAGRRNVLNRLLEQLVDQTHELEAALRERGDDPGEDGYVMRAELDALREHIGIVERQLRNLDRREWPRAEAGERSAEEEAKQLEEHLKRLTEVREEAIDNVRHLEMELETPGDRQGEPRERLERRLRQEQARLDRLTREQKRLEHQVQIESRPEAERAEKVQAMARLRAREARERAQVEDEHRRNLSQHLRELQRHARETERDLDRIDDQDSIEARELRAKLNTTGEAMAQIEQELSRLRAETARAEAERAARSTSARATSRSRQASAQAPLQGGSFHNLLAQIRQTEEELKAARKEEDRPGVERLRRQLDLLHAQREFLERNPGYRDEFVARIFALQHTAPQDASSILARALGGSASVKALANRQSLVVVGTPDAQARAEQLLVELDVPAQERGRKLQVEVEELRGKVDGMHEEMAQMREMLQELLRRRQVEKEEEIQEFKEY